MSSGVDVAEDRPPASTRRPAGAAMGGKRLGLALAVLAAWWCASLGAPAYIFPGPAKTWDALVLMNTEGNFWGDIGVTFARVAAGFLLAALVGGPLGIVLGSNRKLAEFFEPILAVINTVSSAIWAIFAIIWFGISNQTTIFVVFMTSMPLILTNVWQGTQTVNADYIELARTYHTILVSNVPQFTPQTEDPARRFVEFVDEAYDRGVKLVLSAAAPIVELYDGERLRAEFARTESRLIEMQSEDYLARDHRA